jgi:hypothetical protein
MSVVLECPCGKNTRVDGHVVAICKCGKLLCWPEQLLSAGMLAWWRMVTA